MSWISVDTDVRDHPKTRHLSKLLKCSRHEVIGILVMLWMWGLTNATRDGKISCATAEDIATGVMFTKSPPQQFVEALITAGWLEQESDGNYVLHDWNEWQQLWYKAIDKRKSNAEAQREFRARKSGQSFEDPQIKEIVNISECGLDKTDRAPETQSVDGQSLCEATDSSNTLLLSKEKSKHSASNCQQIVDLFHTLCPSLQEVRKLSDSRKRAIASFSKKYSEEEIRLLFEKAERSSFLKGNNANGWSAKFDWLIKDSNAAKVLDGNYDDSERRYKTVSKPTQPDYSDTTRYTNIRME